MTVPDFTATKDKKRKSMSSASEYLDQEGRRISPSLSPQQPLDHSTRLTDSIRSLEDPSYMLDVLEGEAGLEHRSRELALARAEKKVSLGDRPLAPTSPPSLPNEILFRVLESLLSDQSALYSCALVSITWHRCAVQYLYRYPRFASTLHWALFIQTLCRSKTPTRPKTRRRPSIIQSLTRSRQFSPHPPLQLAPAMIEILGGQTQWRNDRLIADLGRYVHGINFGKRPSPEEPRCCKSVKCKEQSAGSPCCNTKPPTHTHTETYSTKEHNRLRRRNTVQHANPKHFSRAPLTLKLSTPALLSSSSSSSSASSSASSSTKVTTATNHASVASTCPHDDDGGSDPDDPNDEDDIPRVERSPAADVSTKMSPSRSPANRVSASLPATTILPKVQQSRLGDCSNEPIRSRLEGALRMMETGMDGWGSSSSSPTPTSHLPPSTNSAHSSTYTAGSGTRASLSASLIPSAGHTTHTGSASSTSNASNSSNGTHGTLPSTDTKFKRPITITVSSLIELTRHCPNLEILSMTSAHLAPDTLNLETGDYQSTTQLGPHTGLTFVAVTTRDAITAIGNNCSKLQQLTLSGCDWLTTEEVMTLVTQCRQLFLLDLNRCSKLDSRFCQLFVVTDDMMNNSADRAVLGPDMPISLLWYMHQSIPPEHLLFNEGEDQIYDPVSLMDREKEGNLSVVHKHGRASRAIVREYGQNQGYNGRVGVRDGAMSDLLGSILSGVASTPKGTEINTAMAPSPSHTMDAAPHQGSQIDIGYGAGFNHSLSHSPISSWTNTSANSNARNGSSTIDEIFIPPQGAGLQMNRLIELRRLQFQLSEQAPSAMHSDQILSQTDEGASFQGDHGILHLQGQLNQDQLYHLHHPELGNTPEHTAGHVHLENNERGQVCRDSEDVNYRHGHDKHSRQP